MVDSLTSQPASLGLLPPRCSAGQPVAALKGPNLGEARVLQPVCSHSPSCAASASRVKRHFPPEPTWAKKGHNQGLPK